MHSFLSPAAVTAASLAFFVLPVESATAQTCPFIGPVSNYTGWVPRTPQVRTAHAMARFEDPGGADRVVIFGGRTDGGVILDDTWSWDGVEWRQLFPTNRPSPRSFARMTMDANGSIVLYGGRDASANLLSDTWTWDGSDWTLESASSAPGPMAGHGMAFDRANDYTVLRGAVGVDPTGGGIPLDSDTWTWDGFGWTFQATDSLGLYTSFGMAYDATPGGQRVIMSAGATFEWTGTAWTSLPSTTSRSGAVLGGLPQSDAGGGVVLFGGRTTQGPISLVQQTEIFSGGWTSMPATPIAPSGAVDAGMAYDTNSPGLILFGGDAGVTSSSLRGQTWRWNSPGIWTPLSPSLGLVPGAAYDAARGVVVVFGGFSSCLPGTDATWEYDGTTWTRFANPISGCPGITWPPPRSYTSMVYDSARERIVLFGGIGPSGVLNDTWEWDGATWTRINTPNSPPPNGTGHPTLAYDSLRERTVLVSDFIDWATWEYDGTDWVENTLANTPRLFDSRIAYDARQGQIVMFGGRQGLIQQNTTYVYDGVTWALVSPATSPPARDYHVMAYDSNRARIVIHGGELNRKDTWEWDGVDWTQRVQPATGSVEPFVRSRHAMAYDSRRGRMVMVSRSEVWELVTPAASLDDASVNRAKLCAQSDPILGQTFDVTVPAPTGASGGCFLLVDALPQIPPVPSPLPGVVGQLSYTSAVPPFVLSAPCNMPFTLPLPADPNLIDQPLTMQGLVYTSLAPLTGLLTDGLAIRLLER